MVAQSETRQGRRRIARNMARHGGKSVQKVCNNLLWRIAMRNGGKVNILCSELKQVPAAAGLKVQYDQIKDLMIITAVNPESKLILPPTGIIDGG